MRTQVKPFVDDIAVCTTSIAANELITAANKVSAVAYDLARDSSPNYVVSLLTISRSIEKLAAEMQEAS